MAARDVTVPEAVYTCSIIYFFVVFILQKLTCSVSQTLIKSNRVKCSIVCLFHLLINSLQSITTLRLDVRFHCIHLNNISLFITQINFDIDKLIPVLGRYPKVCLPGDLSVVPRRYRSMSAPEERRYVPTGQICSGPLP